MPSSPRTEAPALFERAVSRDGVLKKTRRLQDVNPAEKLSFDSSSAGFSFREQLMLHSIIKQDKLNIRCAIFL